MTIVLALVFRDRGTGGTKGMAALEAGDLYMLVGERA
jgi:hypothetical protein